MSSSQLRFRAMIVLSLLMSGLISGSFAQEKSDTTGYEGQRQKVNNLLNERGKRFGQFDESLQKRTGIFGLKTKKDMQASIDILKQIVLTDNDIFQETKALLDFKDFEKSQITERATEFDGRINGYIKTISKLQREHERMTEEIGALEKANQFYQGLVLLLALFVVGGIIFFIRRRQKLTKS